MSTPCFATIIVIKGTLAKQIISTLLFNYVYIILHIISLIVIWPFLCKIYSYVLFQRKLDNNPILILYLLVSFSFVDKWKYALISMDSNTRLFFGGYIWCCGLWAISNFFMVVSYLKCKVNLSFKGINTHITFKFNELNLSKWYYDELNYPFIYCNELKEETCHTKVSVIYF